jgi:radical SAM superfamily enzyme YgiQ (UPF0313 family)
MKLALVSLDKRGALPPLGLGYIASYLRKYLNFYDTVIVDKEDFIKKIIKEKPDMVGISSVTEYFPKAKELAEEIKAKLEIPVLVGGIHISLLPQSLPKCFDIGVIGEGEQTILEIVQRYEKFGEIPKEKLEEINGLVFHKNNKVCITKPRESIRPLDNIPFPARDIFKMKEYLQPRFLPHISGKLTTGTDLITARGCPYRCIFCSTSLFWKTVRFHSPEYVVNEIKEIIEKYKPESIAISDDLFIIDKNRLKKIVELIKKEKINEQVEFGCYGRANLMTDEICKLLSEMNVKFANFGYESGSDKILNYLKKGTVTVEDNRKSVEICKRYNMTVAGSFIIGNPGETKDDIDLTFKFIKDNPIDSTIIFILSPYPGTEIWNLAKNQGIVSDDMDWSRLGLGIKGREDEIFFLPKDMTKEEFLNKLSEIREFIDVKNNKRSKVSFKYLFHPTVIKHLIKDPKRIYNYINGKIRS